MPELSVIIPVVNLVPDSLQERLQTLNFALSNFYAMQTAIDFEVIIVEQSLDGEYYYFDKLENTKAVVKTIRIEYPIFNKQWCINVGVRHTESTFIVMAEPDMYVSRPDYLRKLVAFIKEKKLKWAFGWNKLYYTDQEEKEDIMVIGYLNEHDSDRLRKPRSGWAEGGFVIYEKHFFVSELGYANEWIQGLGGPDNAIAARSTNTSGTYEGAPFTVYHLWHQGGKGKTMTHRKQNQVFVGLSRMKAKKVNEYLRTLSPGQKDAPLCAHGEFMNGQA